MDEPIRLDSELRELLRIAISNSVRERVPYISGRELDLGSTPKGGRVVPRSSIGAAAGGEQGVFRNDAAGPFSFGSMVRCLREQQALSRRQVARPGLSVDQLREVEANTRRPTPRLILALAAGLNIPASDLETMAGDRLDVTELELDPWDDLFGWDNEEGGRFPIEAVTDA